MTERKCLQQIIALVRSFDVDPLTVCTALTYYFETQIDESPNNAFEYMLRMNYKSLVDELRRLSWIIARDMGMLEREV